MFRFAAEYDYNNVEIKLDLAAHYAASNSPRLCLATLNSIRISPSELASDHAHTTLRVLPFVAPTGVLLRIYKVDSLIRGGS